MVDEAISCAAAALGYPSVRREQIDAVRAIASGNDVFVALPTGYGKSLCYAMLPLVFDKLHGRSPKTSIVVCISPLVALMQDRPEGKVFSKRTELITTKIKKCTSLPRPQHSYVPSEFKPMHQTLHRHLEFFPSRF